MEKNVRGGASQPTSRLKPLRVQGGAAVLLLALIVCMSLGAGSTARRELPDARTWRFFSEKKIRSRLFIVLPGATDSISVSDQPACCQEVSPNGRWVACTVFNPKAIENELLVVSRQLDRWWPLPGYTAISYTWSPDGRSLAGVGKRRAATSVCFFAVDPIAQSAWVADSMLTPEDYEFAWDSTSHRVAICRPGSGAKDPPRVLLYSVLDRKMSTLATLAEGVPSAPYWLPNGTLVVRRESSAPGDSAIDLRFPLPAR